MKKYLFALLVILIGCNPQPSANEKEKNKLLGDWQFLDIRGNYVEAFFDDSTYFIYNQKMGHSPKFNYFIINDSLYSNVDKRKSGINKTAQIIWLNENKVIMRTEFSRDTMDRITEAAITLGNTDLKRDSAIFREAISNRHEDYLLAKRILTPEEIKEFKETKIIPEDVLRK